MEARRIINREIACTNGRWLHRVMANFILPSELRVIFPFAPMSAVLPDWPVIADSAQGVSFRRCDPARMTSLTIAGLPITAGGLPGVAWSAAGAGRQPAITAMYSAIRWIVIDGHSAVGGDCRTVDAGYTDAVALDLGLKQPATPGLPPTSPPPSS